MTMSNGADGWVTKTRLFVVDVVVCWRSDAKKSAALWKMYNSLVLRAVLGRLNEEVGLVSFSVLLHGVWCREIDCSPGGGELSNGF